MVNHTARRINYLAKALEAKTYLEIGVCEGETFFQVEIGHRTGVDPNFRFDYTKRAADDIVFFSGLSDAYFGSQLKIHPKDLIFIDGLHTFEQTARDFFNALMYSHPKTVLLIDDTKPSDAFSAIPDIKRAMNQRRIAGTPSPAWHGDVYKLVFLIHDFLPSLNYRTISEGGNQQTVVWRAPRDASRTPRFNNLEHISRLTYFDLVDNIDILRLSAEKLALDTCLEEVVGT